jgi:hypothetical protein
MADIAIRFWDLVTLSRDQKKLLPHFGQASTAVFAVEEVEDGGHDRTPSFDHHHAIICSGWVGIPTARGHGTWSAVQVARVPLLKNCAGNFNLAPAM